MKTRLLSTVAATLLIGVGAASAQTMNKEQAPTRAPAAQQNAPAEKVAPPLNAGERKAPETSGQAASDAKPGTALKPGSDMKAGDSKAGDKPAMKSTDSAKPDAAPNRSATETKSDASKSTTTGQGAAAGQANLSSEQRTKITTVIKSQKVERVEPSQLKVSINIGTRIPSHVRMHRLPTEVITIYPQWRGYDYILVGDQILVLDPRTHEIVFIIEA